MRSNPTNQNPASKAYIPFWQLESISLEPLFELTTADAWVIPGSTPQPERGRIHWKVESELVGPRKFVNQDTLCSRHKVYYI